jgi:serine/threonine/tyrosine-interacting protein
MIMPTAFRPLRASSVLSTPGDAYGDTYTCPITTNVIFEWTYERRREAQMILPYLYLGPMTAAKDEAWMREEGITMVLGVRQKHAFSFKLMDAALRRTQAAGVEARTVDLANNQDLIHAFPETTAMICTHLRRTHAATGHLGKVLIFCESGNERSAGVTAAYLMETHEDVDYIKAMQLCQAQRFCVNFDDSMKRVLQGYWDILCAKRSVAADRRQIEHNDVVRSKRSLQRDDDEGDEDMDGMKEDDLERFGGRAFVPFTDAPYDGYRQ